MRPRFKRLQAERAPQVRSPTQERWEVYIPLRDSCAKSSRNRLDRPTHLQCHKTMPRFRRAHGAPARRGDTACGVHSWGGLPPRLPPVPRVPPTSIIRTLPKEAHAFTLYSVLAAASSPSRLPPRHLLSGTRPLPALLSGQGHPQRTQPLPGPALCLVPAAPPWAGSQSNSAERLRVCSHVAREDTSEISSGN